MGQNNVNIGEMIDTLVNNAKTALEEFEKFKENKNEDNTNGMDEMLMDALVDSSVKKGKLKEAEEFDKKVKKLEYERQLRQMDMETMMKIRERKLQQKELKKNSGKSKNGSTS